MSKANTRVIDLPSKQNPTGNEQVYIATENTDEKISLGEIREFFAEELSRKSNNLSDIDALQARNNLSVYSKAEVDIKTGVQDESIRAIERKNTEQDQRLQNIETKNTEQDKEIDKKSNKGHTHTTEEITDFTEKTNEIIREKIVAGENITLTEEDNHIKITATGGNGGSGGDMLKSVYDRNNNGKVDIAERAESVEWENIEHRPDIEALKEQVDGKLNANDTMVAKYNTAGGVRNILINGNDGGNGSARMELRSRDNNWSYMRYSNNDTTTWDTGTQGGNGAWQIREDGGNPRLSISTGGNIGVGTTVPSAKFHIQGSGNQEVLKAEHNSLTTQSGMRISSNSITTGALAIFDSSSSGHTSRNTLIRNTNEASNATTLEVINQGSGKLAIFSGNGNVGVGTNNPSEKLQVDGRIRSNGIIQMGNNGEYWWGGQLEFRKNATENIFWSIGGRSERDEGLLFETIHRNTLNQPLLIKTDGSMESRYMTSRGESRYIKMGSRSALGGVQHTSGGHEYQIAWGNLSNDTENASTATPDGGWGLFFGANNFRYIEMKNKNVSIGNSLSNTLLKGNVTLEKSQGNQENSVVRKDYVDGQIAQTKRLVWSGNYNHNIDSSSLQVSHNLNITREEFFAGKYEICVYAEQGYYLKSINSNTTYGTTFYWKYRGSDVNVEENTLTILNGCRGLSGSIKKILIYKNY